MPESADTLIHARWVIPIEPAATTLENASVALREGRIVDVCSYLEAKARFQPAAEVTLPHHVLLPGFVNAHTHASMTLFRGLGADLPLMDWLTRHIWPAEQRWVSEDFVRAGSELAAIEMLRGGTTCFNDMYFHPEIVARAARAAGMRACVGLIVLDFPSSWASNWEEYILRGERVHDELRGMDGIVTAFAPHAPYTVGDDALRRIRVLADELGIPVHMHVHETAHEVEESQKLHGMRPLERLSRLGLLAEPLIAVHMTQLLPGEIEAVAGSGASVVHCPESNLKLASGMCPVATLLKAGVNVALGTDGAASNNDLDMIGELRCAALLAKGVAADPTALPAHQALRIATLSGARALGLGDELGSLEAGKSADLIAIELDRPHTQPVYDAAAQVVYCATRDQVTDVWVAGRRVVANSVLTTLQEAAVLDAAREWAVRIAASDSASETNQLESAIGDR
jgi:5-methylthioadenosine/S-adenosylhomocysteine deaminase